MVLALLRNFVVLANYCLKMDLHKAAERGNLEYVRLLLRKGADKDKGDSNGFTPLYGVSSRPR